jgi:hypothetical protein
MATISRGAKSNRQVDVYSSEGIDPAKKEGKYRAASHR